MGNVINLNADSGSGVRLASISIVTPPAKTAYKAGDTFNPAGMVVNAVYTNGAVMQVTGYSFEPSTPLAAGTTSVTIRYSEGGISKTATQAITCTKTSVPVPTFTQTLTYNTNTQTPSFNNDPGSIATKSGDTMGLNAGNYSCRFTLNNTDLYVWADGSTAAYKEVAWSIGKATPTFSVSPSSVALDSSHLTRQATISTNSDGAVTPSSSDPSVATASVSGSIVTVSHVNKTSGTATITLNLAATTNYKAASKTIAVTASFISSTLNDNDWATISEVSQAGTGDTYWDVGDAKQITLNGTIGTKTFSNVSLCVYILHFNMPTNKNTADNNIIWQGFKSALTGGKDVALRDWTGSDPYGSYKEDGTKLFNMNHWGAVNYGGWKGCDFRYDILGGTDTQPSGYGSKATTSRAGYDATTAAITSPKANTVMAALPSDLRAALRLWTRYIDAKGNSSNVDANVQATVDALSLLAEFEIFGSRTYANQYEKNHQTQCDYYKNGNSKIRYAHDSTSLAVFVWEASPRYNNADYFCLVSNLGDATRDGANHSFGLAPAFKT